VYSKLIRYLVIPVVLLLLTGNGIAQTAPPPASGGAAALAPATQATLRGKITDPSGALIPGAQITLSNLQGRTVATATADA
jgi:hypothetical protein